MNVKGSFEVKMAGDPPYSEVDGISLSRASLEKVFSGPLSASSKMQMLAARTPVANSAAYVGVERIEGTLEGKQGSFVVVHTGLMTRGEPSLTVSIVPDSGTGELAGISGRISIQIEAGKHFYELEYSLPT